MNSTRFATGCGRARIVVAMLAVSVLMTVAPGLAYIDYVSLTVLPEAPRANDSVRLLLFFLSDDLGNEASWEEFEPGHIRVVIETTLPCVLGAPCPPNYERIELSLGSLEAGTYSVDVVFQEEVLLATSFAVGPGEDDSPQLTLTPSPATVEDFVAATVALRVEDCGMPLPQLVGIETTTLDDSSVVDVRLERSLSGVPCEIGPTRLGSIHVPLGALPLGQVDVRVVLDTIALPGAGPVEKEEGQVLVSKQIQVLEGDARGVLAGRFEIRAKFWESDPEAARTAQPVALQRAASNADDSVLFSFYDPDNWELLVKVLDGCAINGHYWVFAAAATDVGWQVEVVDLQTDESYSAGQEFQSRQAPITEITALPCS